MSEMGTSIDSLRQNNEEEDTLIKNIKEDYTEQTLPQKQLEPEPIINQIQHQPVEEYQHYQQYEPEEINEKPSMLSTVFTTVKDAIIFLIIFITFNYEPIALVVDSLLDRLNIPYLGLVLRAIIASVVYFFIKKFI